MMALGDLMASRFSQSSSPSVSNYLDEFSGREHSGDVAFAAVQRREQEAGVVIGVNPADAATTSMAYLPQTLVFCDFRHEGFEDCVPLGPSERGLVSKWRPKDRLLVRKRSSSHEEHQTVSGCHLNCWFHCWSDTLDKIIGILIKCTIKSPARFIEITRGWFAALHYTHPWWKLNQS